MGKCFFIRISPVLVFHTHTCLLIACLHTHPCILTLHTLTLTLAYFALGCFRSSSVCVCVSVEVSVCKCKCRSVSVQGIFRKNPSQCFRERTIYRINKKLFKGINKKTNYLIKKNNSTTNPLWAGHRPVY